MMSNINKVVGQQRLRAGLRVVFGEVDREPQARVLSDFNPCGMKSVDEVEDERPVGNMARGRGKIPHGIVSLSELSTEEVDYHFRQRF